VRDRVVTHLARAGPRHLGSGRSRSSRRPRGHPQGGSPPRPPRVLLVRHCDDETFASSGQAFADRLYRRDWGNAADSTWRYLRMHRLHGTVVADAARGVRFCKRAREVRSYLSGAFRYGRLAQAGTVRGIRTAVAVRGLLLALPTQLEASTTVRLGTAAGPGRRGRVRARRPVSPAALPTSAHDPGCDLGSAPANRTANTGKARDGGWPAGAGRSFTDPKHRSVLAAAKEPPALAPRLRRLRHRSVSRPPVLSVPVRTAWTGPSCLPFHRVNLHVGHWYPGRPAITLVPEPGDLPTPRAPRWSATSWRRPEPRSRSAPNYR